MTRHITSLIQAPWLITCFEMAVTVLCAISYITAIILVSCLGCLLFLTAYIHHMHRITDHIPGPPRSSFIMGHIPDFRKYIEATGGTLSEFVMEKRFEYGPIFVLHFAHRPIVHLGDSSYLRHVYINNHSSLGKEGFLYNKIGFIYGERGVGYGLVSNTNEQLWRERRRLMNPAFHRKSLRDFMGNFNNVCDRFLARMNTVVEGCKPVSMVSEFAKVALEAISQVSFNIDTKAIEDSNSPFPNAVRHYLRGVDDNLRIPLSPSLLAIFQCKLFQNATMKEQLHAARFLKEFARDCISNRMKDIADDKAVPNDLLSVLIKDGSLSMDDIIDEFLTIFIAGQETTGNSLSFTLYEIIRNPHVEAKLLNEISEVLGERNYVEFDDLAKLKYLGQVFNESLRKHPVAAAPARITVKSLTVGGYYIPKGVGVDSNQLFFAMNPEIWKDPEIFDPERFANVESMPNYSMTHFPFSMGPRICLGQTFAKFESKVILAKLIKKFQFRLLPNQTDRKEARLTYTPRDGVMCDVTRRE